MMGTMYLISLIRSKTANIFMRFLSPVMLSTLIKFVSGVCFRSDCMVLLVKISPSTFLGRNGSLLCFAQALDGLKPLRSLFGIDSRSPLAVSGVPDGAATRFCISCVGKRGRSGEATTGGCLCCVLAWNYCLAMPSGEVGVLRQSGPTLVLSDISICSNVSAIELDLTISLPRR